MTRMAKLDPLAGGAPTGIVLLLHGYGSNGDDLIGLAPHWRQAAPNVVFVSPDAPERCPGSPGGFQWWGLSSLDRSALAGGVVGAAVGLDATIDALLADYGLGGDRLILAGFSQGTMMALHAGLRRPVAGIIGYSGMLADPSEPPAGSRPPVLLVHGSADTVVPVAALHAAKSGLERFGCSVTAHVSPGIGHSVDPTGLRLGGEFVARVLG